jgi:hypothetical protein
MTPNSSKAISTGVDVVIINAFETAMQQFNDMLKGFDDILVPSKPNHEYDDEWLEELASLEESEKWLQQELFSIDAKAKIKNKSKPDTSWVERLFTTTFFHQQPSAGATWSYHLLSITHHGPFFGTTVDDMGSSRNKTLRRWNMTIPRTPLGYALNRMLLRPLSQTRMLCPAIDRSYPRCLISLCP